MTNYDDFFALADELLEEFGVAAILSFGSEEIAVIAAVPYDEEVNPTEPGHAGPVGLRSMVRGDVSIPPQSGGLLTIGGTSYTIGKVFPRQANHGTVAQLVAYEFEVAA